MLTEDVLRVNVRDAFDRVTRAYRCPWCGREYTWMQFEHSPLQCAMDHHWRPFVENP